MSTMLAYMTSLEGLNRLKRHIILLWLWTKWMRLMQRFGVPYWQIVRLMVMLNWVRLQPVLFEMEPDDIGNYVLLANTYALMNKWDSGERLRQVTSEKEMKKYREWRRIKKKKSFDACLLCFFSPIAESGPIYCNYKQIIYTRS